MKSSKTDTEYGTNFYLNLINCIQSHRMCLLSHEIIPGKITKSQTGCCMVTLM